MKELQEFIKDRLRRAFAGVPEEYIETLVVVFLELIATKRVSEHVAQKSGLILMVSDDHNLNEKWRITMSALTDAMNAALTNLQSKLNAAAPTAEQITASVHAVVDPAVADLTAKVTAITTAEGDDAAKIADLTTAVTEFTTALAPATTPAPTTATSTTSALNTGATSTAATGA